MVAACTRVRGLSLRWRTGEPEHCRGDWPVLVHLGKVTVIKTAVLRVLSGRYDQDDNWDEKIFQKLQISAVILQPNYNPILLNADIATLKQPPRQDPHQPLCPAHLPLCRPQHFFPRVPHREATGRLWQHEEHWLQESSLCSGGGLDGRLVAV